MFKVGHPAYLWSLLIVPLLALLYWRAHARFSRKLREAVDPALVPVVAPRHRAWRAHLQAGLVIAACALLAGAAAWPMVGVGTRLARATGIDVVFALDVSKSMQAKDVTPSRLERAKLEVSEFIKTLSGDRVGVVVFAGEAFIQCPLTNDYDAARLFMRSIEWNSVPQPGTSLKKAIETSREMLKHVPEGAKSKVLVLLTDGEDHEGGVAESAKAAADEGIVIHAIGIGSTSGEPVPDYDEKGVMKGYKKDKAGQTVLSRLNETALKQVTSATGGRYVHAVNRDLGMDAIRDEIARMAKTETQSRLIIQYDECFRWFLLPAAVFLFVGGALLPLSATPWRRQKKA
jgi:Ca-activated chloride channel family protein